MNRLILPPHSAPSKSNVTPTARQRLGKLTFQVYITRSPSRVIKPSTNTNATPAHYITPGMTATLRRVDPATASPSTVMRQIIAFWATTLQLYVTQTPGRSRAVRQILAFHPQNDQAYMTQGLGSGKQTKQRQFNKLGRHKCLLHTHICERQWGSQKPGK